MTYNNCVELGTNWCIVTYFLLSISTVLLFLTILLYISIYKQLGYLSPSQHLVFIGQFLQCIAMALHYTFIGDNFDIIFLLQEYLLSVQYSLVFYYFLSQLSENVKNLRRVKNPLILLNILMLLGFLIYVTVLITTQKLLYNCNNGIWVYLHGCGIVLSIIFIALGANANKTLKTIHDSLHSNVDSNKIKHFWIIIITMLVASIANIGESLYFIDITNQSCYNSYSSNEIVDIFAFTLIRLTSHYIFLFSCLFIFKVEQVQSIYSELNSDSSFKGDGVYDNLVENSWTGASSSLRFN